MDHTTPDQTSQVTQESERMKSITIAHDICRCVRYPASYIEGITEAMAKEQA